MKQILFFTASLFVSMTLFGQGVPDDITPPPLKKSQTVNPTPSNNYTITYTYRDTFTVNTSNWTSKSIPAIQYFDGLGRPTESILVNSSPLGYDMIDKKEYDAFGNLIKEYLPYSKTSDNFGNFVTNFATEQNSFIGGLYPSEGSYGYSIAEYEKSPLERVVKQGAPGSSWQLTKPVITTYRTNTVADSVQTYLYTNDSPSAYTYPAGKLYVTETTDEDGKTVREVKDIDGKVVEKYINGARTKYCYDQFGRLKSVMQPTATNSTDSYSTFQYKYDFKGRLTDKKLPNVSWFYYIYDSRDRLVLSQDAIQRSKTTPEWSYTIYDDFNRPVEQGTWATTTLRTTLTNSINGSLTYMSGQTSRTPLKYLYYDKYPVDIFSGYTPNTSDYSALYATQSASDIGRQTGERTKLLDIETGMNTWIFNAFYYDKFGRVIQTVSDNHLGGKDYVTNKYNFAGETMQTRYRHIVGTVTVCTDTGFDRDHRGRLKKTRLKIDTSPEVLLSGNNYYESGNLKTQFLHSVSGGTFLQKNDYIYNIRGWMTQMNNPSSFSENDVFAMKLEYNPALFNGNISKFTWAYSSNDIRNYTYTYDGNNRITAANFSAANKTGNELDESFTYDKNGNITGFRRYDYTGILIDSIKSTYNGNRLSGSYDKQGDVASIVDYPGSITNKLYNYDSNGNMTGEPHRNIATLYNMLNLPKQISWNGLNRKISYFYTFNGEKLRKTVEDNGTITKVDYCGPFVYETVSGVPSLKYIITPHGRAEKSGSSWLYYYNITDHLGNVRTEITPYIGGAPLATQKRNYYTFGMEMSQLNSGSVVNKYQYNGKEIQDDFGLYWYDYGARFYDPMIGRWHSVDPMAEKYYSLSPYNYVANNPIKFIDPDGNDILIWYKKDDGGMGSYKYTGGSVSNNNKFIQSVAAAWNYNVGNGGGDPSFEAATNNNILLNVYETDGNSMHSDGTIYWNPELGSEYENGTVVSPATVLDHELDHGVQRATNRKQFESDRTPKSDKQYGTKEEKRVITGSEQKTARANKESKDGKVTRTNHKGKPVITKGVTSTKVNNERTQTYRRKQSGEFYRNERY